MARDTYSKDYPYNEGNFRDSRMNRIIVLENLNFIWDRSELIEIKRMWKKDVSMIAIAEHFKRDPDEVLLALIHLAREDKINRRKGGLF